MTRTSFTAQGMIALFCAATMMCFIAADARAGDDALNNTPLSGSMAVADAATVAVPKHLADAEALVSELPAATLNVYDDTTKHPFIDWNPAHPAARTVCSSFACLLIQHSYGITDAQMVGWMHRTHPNAAAIHDAIVDQHGFSQVTDIRQIRGGDFLAVKYYDKSKHSGHTMLVAAAPIPRLASAPIVAGTTQYTIEIIDSALSGHGTKDTRHIAVGPDYTSHRADGAA